MGIFPFSMFWNLFQWWVTKLLLSEELNIYFRQYPWSHLLNISVNKNCPCIVCSLIWYGYQEQRKTRPAQVQQGDTNFGVLQSMVSDQAKQDKTYMVVCWTEASFGFPAMSSCHISVSKVSLWVKQTQLQHLKWLHVFAQCPHWADTGGTPSFSSAVKFFLSLKESFWFCYR